MFVSLGPERHEPKVRQSPKSYSEAPQINRIAKLMSVNVARM